MDAKEYRWHVSIMKQLYPALKLTFEQAEQLYLMEQVTKETPDSAPPPWHSEPPAKRPKKPKVA